MGSRTSRRTAATTPHTPSTELLEWRAVRIEFIAAEASMLDAQRRLSRSAAFGNSDAWEAAVFADPASRSANDLHTIAEARLDAAIEAIVARPIRAESAGGVQDLAELADMVQGENNRLLGDPGCILKPGDDPWPTVSHFERLFAAIAALAGGDRG